MTKIKPNYFELLLDFIGRYPDSIELMEKITLNKYEFLDNLKMGTPFYGSKMAISNGSFSNQIEIFIIDENQDLNWDGYYPTNEFCELMKEYQIHRGQIHTLKNFI